MTDFKNKRIKNKKAGHNDRLLNLGDKFIQYYRIEFYKCRNSCYYP